MLGKKCVAIFCDMSMSDAGLFTNVLHAPVAGVKMGESRGVGMGEEGILMCFAFFSDTKVGMHRTSGSFTSQIAAIPNISDPGIYPIWLHFNQIDAKDLPEIFSEFKI